MPPTSARTGRRDNQVVTRPGRQLVGYLSADGMSTRAIAPAVGVSPRQAAYDKAAGVQSLHTSPAPSVESPRVAEFVDTTTDQKGVHSSDTLPTTGNRHQ